VTFQRPDLACWPGQQLLCNYWEMISTHTTKQIKTNFILKTGGWKLIKSNFLSPISDGNVRRNEVINRHSNVLCCVVLCFMVLSYFRIPRNAIDQWYSTGDTRTPGGTRRHLRGYVKFKISLYILFHE
jgi:hypothetical protein